MARSIADIKKSITDRLISDPAIIAAYQLAPGKTFEEEFSAASVESILMYSIANGIYVHEAVFDAHKEEMQRLIDNMKPHSLQWYANNARAYQKGFALIGDSDKYDNTGITDEVITASKIINYAAVVEQERGLRIKVATDAGTDLGAVATGDMPGFIAYMQRIKDAGVKLSITTAAADALKLGLLIKYDPLVLDSEGKRLDGNGPETVQDAIRLYLKNLPFNGRLELSDLVDVLQLVNGVKAAYVTQAQKRYGTLPFTSFENMMYEPDGGYLRIYDYENDLQIIFEANA